MFSLTPPICPGCDLDPEEAKEEGFEDGFLMFPIPTSGICHFVCPRCFVVMMNKECFEAQKELREKAESRVILSME